MITITPIPAFKDNYIWLLTQSANNKCIVVDPGDANPVLAFLQASSLQLAAILITHHHADHSGGITELYKHYKVSVFGPANEAIAGVTELVKADDEITIAEFALELSVLAIPGHTRGHVAYYNKQMVFCGDTLFTAGCGRLFEGTAQQMYTSLMQLAALPDDTLIYCGHEYTAANLLFAQTVEPNNLQTKKRYAETQLLRAQNIATVPAALTLEKQTNPFLRCYIPNVIKAAEDFAKEKLSSPVDVFRVLRAWKDSFRA